MKNILKLTCLLLCLILWVGQEGQAQISKEVRITKGKYRQVSRLRERGRLFESVSELNKGGLRIPRVGTFNRIERYFYQLTPEKKPTLKTILVKIERNNVRYNQEFLFNEQGEPIYVFESQNDFKKFKYRILRVYFHKDQLIQWVKGRAVIDGKFLQEKHKIRARYLLQEAKKYYQRYKVQVAGIENMK